MTTLGAFHAEIELKNKLSEVFIYVEKGKHGSLLSYHTALQLDLIRLRCQCATVCTTYDSPGPCRCISLVVQWYWQVEITLGQTPH